MIASNAAAARVTWSVVGRVEDDGRVRVPVAGVADDGDREGDVGGDLLHAGHEIREFRPWDADVVDQRRAQPFEGEVHAPARGQHQVAFLGVLGDQHLARTRIVEHLCQHLDLGVGT